MEQVESAPETPEIIIKDLDRVRRLIGSYGVVDALEEDLPHTPEHENDNIWKSNN